MQELLNFTTGMSVVLILMVLVSIRRAHIRVEYSVSWLGAALTLLILAQSPGTLEKLGRFLGLSNPPMALVFFIGCLFLLVMFRFSVIISDLKDANIALAQRVAILEYYVQSFNEEKATRS